MKIRLTPEARNDLRAIRRYIAKDSRRAADNVISRLRQTVLMFARFPMLGQDGRIEGTREFDVPGLPYTIVFAITASAYIDILTFVHQSLKFPSSEG